MIRRRVVRCTLCRPCTRRCTCSCIGRYSRTRTRNCTNRSRTRTCRRRLAAQAVDDHAEHVGTERVRISLARSANGRPFFVTRIASNTPSTRGATTHGSVTTKSGGVSMITKSYWARMMSSNSLNRGEVSNSAGLAGRGPQGRTDEIRNRLSAEWPTPNRIVRQ